MSYSSAVTSCFGKLPSHLSIPNQEKSTNNITKMLLTSYKNNSYRLTVYTLCYRLTTRFIYHMFKMSAVNSSQTLVKTDRADWRQVVAIYPRFTVPYTTFSRRRSSSALKYVCASAPRRKRNPFPTTAVPNDVISVAMIHKIPQNITNRPSDKWWRIHAYIRKTD